ncbi:MAG TPA: pyridoxal phosphate-dependent aminotransferase [Puia sp.]|jgi:aspartate/methionine/tyrosine aminotransferase|nr:pyridoxal phosphate-dependent aminotransferase [Puia sp.]
MDYRRMPIEVESPEQLGYGTIRNNLSESSYTDALFRDVLEDTDLHDLLLSYGSHAGHEGLRAAIVTGTHLKEDDVLLTIGAAGALFIIATSLLEKGDELVVVRPNYATNIETPRAIGAAIQFIDLRFEEKFELNIGKIRAAVGPATQYISVTYPHNPTGVCLNAGELQQLVDLAEEKGVYLLVDETYRDMVFGEQLPPAATLSPRVISVSSVSKTYGLPGLRTGWILCQDRRLMTRFLAAKEQIHICGPSVDEEITFRYWQKRNEYLPHIRADIREKFGLVKEWMENQNDFEWIEPAGGCVCFPRLCRPEEGDIDRFYRILLEKYGTYVGPGHWFEMPRHYMRVGFGWPSRESLEEGLAALGRAWAAARS